MNSRYCQYLAERGIDLAKAVEAERAVLASAPPAKRIKLGMTLAEVLAILGEPTSTLGEEPAKVLQYKEANVVVVNGRVTHVYIK